MTTILECHKMNAFYFAPTVQLITDVVARLLAVLNSSVNFFIYCMVSSQFTDELLLMYRGPQHRNSNSSSRSNPSRQKISVQFSMKTDSVKVNFPESCSIRKITEQPQNTENEQDCSTDGSTDSPLPSNNKTYLENGQVCSDV